MGVVRDYQEPQLSQEVEESSPTGQLRLISTAQAVMLSLPLLVVTNLQLPSQAVLPSTAFSARHALSM